VLQLGPTIAISAAFLSAACAVAAWRLASVSSRTMKRLRDLETMMSDLESSFDSLLESHKRLRSRAGMRELRAREDAPPVEDKKTIRRRLFGSSAGPAFAALQQRLERGDG